MKYDSAAKVLNENKIGEYFPLCFLVHQLHFQGNIFSRFLGIQTINDGEESNSTSHDFKDVVHPWDLDFHKAFRLWNDHAL